MNPPPDRTPAEPFTIPENPDDLEPLAETLPPRSDQRMRFAAGDPVPHSNFWILQKKLGGGGFGEVWLAKHDVTEELRAVKFCIHPAARNQLVTHEKNVVARVMRHARNHPNIVPLHECNLDGQTPWLMYEYVSGGTLADAIPEWRQLSLGKRLGRTVRTLHAIAGALGQFHKFDPPIVHRDMKPHNVMMEGKTPRITDFGLGAAVIQAARADLTGPYSGLSVVPPSMLHAVGTRLYAAPEQMFGSEPDQRADVYSLGVIAYQLILADLKKVPGTDAPHTLGTLGVPPELIALIVKSVAMDPRNRPADATEWEQQLAVFLPKPSSPVIAMPPPRLVPPPTVS